MIVSINQIKFTELFMDGAFKLPQDRGGENFNTYLANHFNYYIARCMSIINDDETNKLVKLICSKLNKTIEHYYCGLPQKAANEFSEIMKELNRYDLRIFQKHYYGAEPFTDSLKLFRIRQTLKVDINSEFYKKDIFHIPYSKREIANNCRYSIPGFPCLYLGTSLELCYRELELSSEDSFIASSFMFQREHRITHKEIYVYDLAQKPSDFMLTKHAFEKINLSKEKIESSIQDPYDIPNSEKDMLNYILWYPLICSVSFVNSQRKNQFSSEYIIPQLFLQWLRIMNEGSKDKLIGIRYFSCRNPKINVSGYNYVFPSSGKGHYLDSDVCNYLADCFKLTQPHIYSFKKFDELDCVKVDLMSLLYESLF